MLVTLGSKGMKKKNKYEGFNISGCLLCYDQAHRISGNTNKPKQYRDKNCCFLIRSIILKT